MWGGGNGLNDVDTLLLCKGWKKALCWSLMIACPGEGDVGAERGPHVSSSPREEPTARRQEGTGRDFLKDPWAAHSTVTE